MAQKEEKEPICGIWIEEQVQRMGVTEIVDTLFFGA